MDGANHIAHRRGVHDVIRERSRPSGGRVETKSTNGAGSVEQLFFWGVAELWPSSGGGGDLWDLPSCSSVYLAIQRMVRPI